MSQTHVPEMLRDVPPDQVLGRPPAMFAPGQPAAGPPAGGAAAMRAKAAEDLQDLLDAGPPEPLVLDVGGTPYTFSALNVRSLMRIQAWLSGLPSPLDEALRWVGKLPEKHADRVLEHVSLQMLDWPPKLGTAESIELLMGPPGLAEICKASLRQGYAHMTDQQVDEVVGRMDTRQMTRVAVLALEIRPKNAPKAEGAAATDAAPPSTGAGSSGGSPAATGGAPTSSGA